ncbi:hypothetical protein DFH08DRAFT_964814 [Mycena albidolilacea]|uniref:Uncharacterized protein n=1 Tax=Mycena albidolilacea TaxID=1033008 RepID=A0AAD7EMV3_9AGAR|nr:hypothetical protein DFH08DRAFT_964814 [Mycena albidolilacea]
MGVVPISRALPSVPETVLHFLLLCPIYRRQRLKLILHLGTARLSLRRLLATKSEHKAILVFTRDTERFPPKLHTDMNSSTLIALLYIAQSPPTAPSMHHLRAS